MKRKFVFLASVLGLALLIGACENTPTEPTTPPETPTEPTPTPTPSP